MHARNPGGRRFPAVEAAARGLADAHLTVLNGNQGVNDILTGLVGQGLAIFDTLKDSVGHSSSVHTEVERADGERSEQPALTR